MNNRLKQQLQKVGLFLGGITAHHYGGRLLDYRQERLEEVAQNLRDEQVDRIEKKIDILKDLWSNVDTKFKILDRFKIVSAEEENLLLKKISNITDSSDKLESVINNSNLNEEIKIYAKEHLGEMIKNLEDISTLIDKWSGSGSGNPDNSFVFNLDMFYDYLNSLTLLEESAFLHIIFFILILLTI